MKNVTIVASKVSITGILALVSSKLGILLPVMFCLMLAMGIDYITGMMSAIVEKMKHPGEKQYGPKSSVGVIGILKKVGYLLGVSVGIMVDWLVLEVSQYFSFNITTNTFFGLMIAIWFTLNELLSIVENLQEIGVKMPKWVPKLLKKLKRKIDDEGSKHANDSNEVTQDGKP